MKMGFKHGWAGMAVKGLGILAVVGLLTACTATVPEASDNAERRPFTDAGNVAEVRSMVDGMAEPEALDSSPAAMGGLSSNPYDYVIGNREYKRILNLGASALPALEAVLNESEESGLREYMVCIAIEEICRSDLKQFPRGAWDSAIQFRAIWPTFVERVPDRTEKIMLGRVPIGERRRQIRTLGRLAIPYVIEHRGHLSPAEDSELAAELDRMTGDSHACKTIDEYATRHSNDVQELRSYVEGQ